MKIRLRGFLELIEWGFESIADRFGVQRRHVLFGIFVLLLSTFITALYIYQKNWVIAGEIKAGQSEKYMTVSLDGEESAMREMANEIRKSILDTPMAAAATSESMAQSSASSNAQRSEPQNSAANQSASASAATASASSAGASSSSFTPTATQANAQVMAGQARSENSQSMAAASPVPASQSTAGSQSVRSNPQSRVAHSAAAKRPASSESASIAGKERPVSPPLISSLASAKMSTRGAKSISGQRMSAAAITQPKIQAVSGASAARSVPQTIAAQSSAVAVSTTATEISMSSSANPNSSMSPSSASQVFQASVKAEGARAETSQGMSQAATQTAAKSASGNSSAHSEPQSATATQSVSASAQSLATTQVMTAPVSQSGNIVPSLSGSRAASSGVQSSTAQAARGQSMARATSQALAQTVNGSRGSVRRGNPVSASSARRESASATRSVSLASGSNGAKAASFAPSVSGSRAAVSEVQNSGAKAVADGSLSGANAQSLAQSATDSQGSARSNPSGTKGNGESSSVQSLISVSAVAGSEGMGNQSLSPTVSGGRAAAMGVRSTGGAQAEKGESLSVASAQSMVKAASGSFGSARDNFSGNISNASGSAKGSNLAATVTGTRGVGSSSFAPTISGRSTAVSGMAGHKARAVAARNMAGISVVASSRPSSAMTASARSGPVLTRGNFTGSAGAFTVRPSISDAGVTEGMKPMHRAIRSATPPESGLDSVSSAPQFLVERGLSKSKSRLGSPKPEASTQVMTQAGTRALVGPMSLGGPRSTRPTLAFRNGAEGPTKKSAQSVSVELRGRSGSSKQMNSRSRTEMRKRESLTAVDLNKQRPKLTAKLVPRQLTPKVMLPVPRSKPTYVQLGDPESNPENPEIRKTQLEQFKTQGFNTRTESKGDRFVFIIDKSESMLDDDRMNGAKQALERTLDKLGPDKAYFIYFFSDKTFKMDPNRMLKATSDNKSETMKWVKSVSAGGFTNPRDALKDAFVRLKPSTIWLLSDGKFSSYKSGRRSNSRRQERLTPVTKVIREYNGAKVRINTIGFAAREGKVDDSLREIARENGGTYRFIPTGDK